MNRAALHRVLKKRFNTNELIQLCFDLGIEDEDLSSGRTALARDLIKHCERTHQIDQLVEKCKEHRPEFDDWDSYLEPYSLTLEQIQVSRRLLIRNCIISMLINAFLTVFWFLFYRMAVFMNMYIDFDNGLLPTATAIGTAIPLLTYFVIDIKTTIARFQSLAKQ